MNNVNYMNVKVSSLFAAALLASLAGCFSTTVPPVPCSSTAGCPTSQSCNLATGTCTPAVSTCTETQIACGGTCYDAAACLSCTDGQCISAPAGAAVTAGQDVVVADGSAKVTFTALVTDSGMHHLAGIPLTASASGTHNTLSATSGMTDANGQFAFTLASTTAEAKTVTVQVGSGAAAFSKTLTATFVAGPPVLQYSAMTLSASSAAADLTGSISVNIVMRDVNQNLINGGTVVYSVSGSGNTLTPSSSLTTGSDGSATAMLTSKKAETKQITASLTNAGKSVALAAQSVTFTAGAPSNNDSTLTVTPTNSATGANQVVADNAATYTVTVTLRDANQNLVPNTAGISIASTGSSNIFSPASGSTNASGVFSATLATKKAEAKSITAIIPNAAGTATLGPVTASFIGGAPSSGTLTSSSGQIVANNSATAVLTLAVLDVQGNNVPPGGYTLSTSSTDTADVFGSWTAQANGTAANTVASTQANAADVISVKITPSSGSALMVTATVNFVAGPPVSANSSISASTTTLSSDSTTGSSVTAKFADANGNPILSGAVTFSASGSGNTFTPCTGSVTDANGTCAFSVTSIKAQTETVTATQNGLALSFSLTVTTGVAASGSMKVVPTVQSPVYADGAQSYTITAALTDKNGNPVSPFSVALTASGTQNTFSAPSGTASGATFTSKIASSLAQTEAVTGAFTADSASVSLTSSNFTFAALPWKPSNTGIYGGDFLSIAIDPTNTSRVYAGSDDALWKTTNSGAAWAQVASVQGSVGGIVVDSSGVLYVGSGNSRSATLISKSTDQGATFTAAKTGPTASDNVYVLKQDPKTSTTFYAGTQNGLWKSIDSAVNFTQIGVSTGFSQVHDVEFDSTSGNLYIAAYNGGAYYSADGGATFTAINGSLDTRGGQAITVDATTNPVTLYYSKTNYPNSGMYVSTNNGGTWTKSTTFPVSFTLAFVIDPKNHNNWFAGGYSGSSYRSTNAGATWTAAYTATLSANIRAIAIDPINSSVIWEATGGGFSTAYGIYRSTDAGSSWTTPNTGITDVYVRSLVVAPSNHNQLYTDAYGSTTSTNGGASWSITNNGLYVNYYHSEIAVDAVDANTAYLGYFYNGFYVTTNAGTSWTQTAASNVPFQSPIKLIADPTTGGRVYAIDASGALYLSNTTGSTWAQVTGAPSASGQLALARLDPKTMYLGTGSGLFKSSNAGTATATFTNVFNFPTYTVAIDPANTSRVVVTNGSDYNVYLSEDGGITWSATTGLVVAATNINAITSFAFDTSTSPSTIYGCNYYGVWKYVSGNWINVSVGLPPIGVNSIAIDPVAPQTLWVAGLHGVYKTTTGAQ